MTRKHMKLPPEPGTAPIKPGYVRLYHQTGADRIPSIKKRGICLDNARGIEGPQAIYAAREPFYGSPLVHYTVEFQIPEEAFDNPFVRTVRNQYGCRFLATCVPPSAFIAVHEPWHSHARYFEKHPEQIHEVLNGEHDAMLDWAGYGPALRWIKKKYGGGR